MSTVTSDCWGIVCFFKFMGLFAKGELSLFNKVSCFFRLETENVSKGALVQCAKRFFWLLMPAKQFTTLENFIRGPLATGSQRLQNLPHG